MAGITGSVGASGTNKLQDVTLVQTLLARHRAWLKGAGVPVPNGQFDETTRRAILAFQAEAAALVPPFQNGVVAPGSFTLTRLEMPQIAGPVHRYFSGLCWYYNDPEFTDKTYKAAAAVLQCDPAAIKAVAENETRRSNPWDPLEGRPLILFERHVFGRLTRHRFDKDHPDIASGQPTPAGRYGPSDKQPRRLWRAAMLDEPAALKSASWGTFQILGENHGVAGYATVEAFVDGMMHSRQAHLDAFVMFIRSNPAALRAIRGHDWKTLARIYNGPNYHAQDYDGRLSRAYAAASLPAAGQP